MAGLVFNGVLSGRVLAGCIARRRVAGPRAMTLLRVKTLHEDYERRRRACDIWSAQAFGALARGLCGDAKTVARFLP